MIYPYLTQPKNRYEAYASYKEASGANKTRSREEDEAYVRYFWPHAFIYEHGPEWTILPMDWRDRERLKVEAPEINIPATLSRTIFALAYKNPELRPQVEGRLWKLAAATVIEYARTEELKMSANVAPIVPGKVG